MKMRPGVRRWQSLLLAAFAVVAVAAFAPGMARADVPTTDISVVDSNGNGIAGVTIVYAATIYSGWNTLGVTDGSGHLAVPAPAGNWLLKAQYYHQGTAQTPSPIDLGTQSYTFHTVKVTLLNGAPLLYAATIYSGWNTFTSPMEMFPGHYVIRNGPWPGHGDVGLDVGPTGFTGGIARLIDHNGNGLAGGTLDYYPPWTALPGQTDANGNLLFSIPDSALGNLYLAMRYHGTRNQQSHAQLNASNFTFQTALANVKLKDADGNPLDTGSASYYATAWQPAQSTSGGVTSFEMLPGSYSFAMTYNHTRQQLNGVAISGPTTDVTFQTGRVTAYFQPGSFYWYNSQFYPFSSGVPQEFLPGQIGLQLPVNGCMTPKFAIAAGDHLVKTGLVATLANSSNQPLAGGIATPYYSGNWQPAFTNPTNGSGRTCEARNGQLGNTVVQMKYNGTVQQLPAQNAQTNGIFAFKTTDVSVKLVDSNGNPLDTGSASYYAGFWRTIGNTSGGSVHVQMLPGSYSFGMTYLGTSTQLNGQVVSGPTSTVTFQTGKVHSDSGNATTYYAGTYWPFTQDMELLPGAYWFQFSDQAQAQYTLVGGTTNHIH